MSTVLNRTTFETSREMDFFSEKELVTQTGHDRSEWPYVFLKECVDNALDACEETDIAPQIVIDADASGITVVDNGPGLPESTLESAKDFNVRASNREAYVAPDRGAQGNALMTLLAMPYVCDPDTGKLIVEAHGSRHEIVCRADPISQRAVIHDDTSESTIESGTLVRIEWAKIVNDVVRWPFDDCEPLEPANWWQSSPREVFTRLVTGYAMLNPHLSITLR